MTNLFVRLPMGAGAEVRVKNGQLMLQPLTSVPSLRRGMRLVPDDPDDHYVFRIYMSHVAQPPMPVVFSGGSPGRQPAQRLCFGPSVFHHTQAIPLDHPHV